MNSRFPMSVLSLAVTAIGLAAAPCAFAGTITNINFSCATGNGVVATTGLATPPQATAGAALCTGGLVTTAGPNLGHPTGVAPTSPTPITSWTQGMYTVAVTGDEWNANQGRVPPANGLAGVVGTPSMSGGTGTGLPAAATFTITDGGAWFNFDSVDLKTNGTMSYTIKGYLGNTLEYTLICGGGISEQNPACPHTNNYFTVNSGSYGLAGSKADFTTDVNKVVISLNSGNLDYLDNVDLTGVPEPSGLLLLGTGLLGLAFALRNRLAV